MQFRQKKRKQPKPVTQEILFRFFQNQVQYICKITAPVFIPKYRVKEAFDREFVGKKAMPGGNPFVRVSRDISYEVLTVKEYEECRMQK